MVMVMWTHVFVHLTGTLHMETTLWTLNAAAFEVSYFKSFFFKKQMSKECLLKTQKNSSVPILTNLLPKFAFNWVFFYI